jgi:CheY-like chemotaxis protein
VLDVNEIVRGVSKLVGRTLEARAQLVLDPCPVPAFIKIDPSQLEQVIANLVVNARDAMPEGGTITVRTAVRDDDPRVVIEIEDTGVGIPEGALADIFEPFFTTKGSGGTGLGLATVREIVTRNGGTIDVHSVIGRGTTFEIRLPWSDDALAQASGAVRAPVKAGRGEAVLVVEDDGAVCEATRRLLGSAGYAVQGVRTAEDALETLATEPAQLVITDIDLPGMSGIDLARQLSTLPVVLTSGRASDVTRLENRRFLPKPYSADDLLRCVRDVLDGVAP